MIDRLVIMRAAKLPSKDDYISSEEMSPNAKDYSIPTQLGPILTCTCSGGSMASGVAGP